LPPATHAAPSALFVQSVQFGPQKVVVSAVSHWFVQHAENRPPQVPSFGAPQAPVQLPPEHVGVSPEQAWQLPPSVPQTPFRLPG
jgi:hypothetical protein